MKKQGGRNLAEKMQEKFPNCITIKGEFPETSKSVLEFIRKIDAAHKAAANSKLRFGHA